MLSEDTLKSLKPEILQFLQEEFPQMKVTDIFLRSDTDSDNDPILRVYIGFAGAMPEQDVRIIVSRKILDSLSEIKEFSFPIITLMKNREFAKERDKGEAFLAVA